jgi:hypothetical protein
MMFLFEDGLEPVSIRRQMFIGDVEELDHLIGDGSFLLFILQHLRMYMEICLQYKYGIKM